ncbi:hypothetical protein JZ751_029723 [Albula glossodonta]|uniref:G-protein coupled receptors family 1 profile domain-containing protein n=1 Tax=Albula glossodonta TaxID=121402 RepID=A0A8T2NHI8_9TELE|nr:hypothetical protein JZ751_029723 [Albula glossodonta]
MGICTRATPTNILLLNLTVSDLLFLLFLPLKMYEAASDMRWYLPSSICIITSFFFFSTIYASSLLLMAVAVDRYLGVTFPIRYKLHRRPMHGIAASVLAWIVSGGHTFTLFFIQGSPQGIAIVENHHVCYENFTSEQLQIVLPLRLEISVVLFFVPLLVSALCYARLIAILCGMPEMSRQKKQRAVAMAAGTLLVYLVCFLPFNISHIFSFDHGNSAPWRSYTLLLTATNTVLDPIIFYFSSAAFQASLRTILTQSWRSSSSCLLGAAHQDTGPTERQGHLSHL